MSGGASRLKTSGRPAPPAPVPPGAGRTRSPGTPGRTSSSPRSHGQPSLGRIAGLQTEWAPRRTLDYDGIDLCSTGIDALMTRAPITIDSDALAVEAAQLMETHQINALLVIDDTRRVVGALNIHDLLRARVV